MIDIWLAGLLSQPRIFLRVSIDIFPRAIPAFSRTSDSENEIPPCTLDVYNPFTWPQPFKNGKILLNFTLWEVSIL